MGRLQTYAAVSCAVNPACGRENDYKLEKAESPKKVLIIGGGVAGCEAARVAALRGHKVILLERGSRLGGNLIAAGTPDFKEDDLALVKWYEQELADLGIDIRLNVEAAKEMILEIGADDVILATGSSPKQLPIVGSKHVYTAEDVLLGKEKAGNDVIVIGGGLVGCETALWLVSQGKKVTIVELAGNLLAVGGPLCHANEDMLKDLVKFKNIDVKVNSKVVKETDSGFIIQTGDAVEEKKADTAIIAIGYNSNQSLYNDIRFDVALVHMIGDANHVQNIMYAIWDAYEVAKNI